MRASSNSLRKGLTLLEVLITIFVMGIGMLAVLTLFPLAAKKISASIDMDRASQMAANAAALAELRGITKAMSLFISNTPPTSGVSSGPSDFFMFDEPGQECGVYTSARSPSVFKVMRWSTASTPYSQISFKSELCVSADEYPFTESGMPEVNSRRGERYCSAYLYRRKRWDDPNTLQLSILVFAGRSIDFANRFDFDLKNISGSAFTSTGGLGTDQISVLDPANYSTVDRPQPDRLITRGSWLMDASSGRWNRFYKVISVDTSVAGQLKLSLDRQLDDPDNIPGNSDDNVSRLIWLDYMVDWFDRGSVQ